MKKCSKCGLFVKKKTELRYLRYYCNKCYKKIKILAKKEVTRFLNETDIF